MSHSSLSFRSGALSCTLLALAALPAQGLVSLNDGRDKFFVSAGAEVTHDTNFYANSFGLAETVVLATVTGEYTRRAGEIGVDASAGVRMAAHQEETEENYQNPFFKMELSKGRGRTTGSLSLKASRENDNDAAANLRTEAWNYGSELNLHYPVMERYSVTANIGYDEMDYQTENLMFDLASFTARGDLNYALNSEHDLTFGYRFRSEDSSGPRDFYNHDISVGLKGRILPKLTGYARVGYQWRDERRGSQTFDSVSAAASATWLISKQNNLAAQVLRDYRTTSTDLTSGVESVSLQYNKSFDAAWSAGVGASAGRIRYYGTSGLGRTDDFSSWNAQFTFSPNEHLRASFIYSYFNNNSTLGFADYSRNRFTLSVSTRW